jgi:hypothetical protein
VLPSTLLLLTKGQHMPGSTSANFHEGSRSEYLAQYIFASFGTAVPVPHQEDTGLDLYCTLTERIGQQIWPRAYFSVQVKSDASAWRFPNPDSVRWLVENPLPVFLCVVDKRDASLQIFHTCPRFYAWSLPPLPESLELTPGTRGDGECVQWKDGTSYSLSAPILAFTITEIQNDAFKEQAKDVLKYWLDVEEQNLRRVKSGILGCSMPYKYKTNEKGDGGIVFHRITYASAEDTRRAIRSFEVQLGWIAETLFRNGDIRGAVRAALLHRYFFNDETDPVSNSLNQIHGVLGDMLGKKIYIYQAIDELSESLDKELEKAR